MIDELGVLKIVIQRLESAGIRYMITGSVAANFYVTPRMTRDIDIVINIEHTDAEQLYSLFSEDFYVDIALIKDAISRQRMFNIIHNEGIIKIDFIIRQDNEYRKVEFDRRGSIDLEGLSVYVVSPEDLILSKLYWAKDSMSGLQIMDVRNLLRIPGIDMEYIKKWVDKLELNEIFKKVVNK